MKLILLGAPGAGKGTQAEVISNEYNIPSISTGNIIREAVRNQTELGIKAKDFIDKGALVPDELVIELVKERIAQQDCQNGFILDGFPRTINQAQALDEMNVIIDKVLDIDVSDDEIVKRLSGRRVCKVCGSSYHIDYKPSKQNGVCDKCSGELILRTDDHPDTVKERLRVYHQMTEPLKEYYNKQSKLISVKGREQVEDTTKAVLEALKA